MGAHSYNRIFYGDENKQTASSQNNMDESHKIKLGGKKSRNRGYILYASIYIKFTTN